MSNYREMPRLSKEQLVQRRAEVVKYYNELSRRNSSRKQERPKRQLTRIAEEKPVEESWAELKDLTSKLTTMNCEGIVRSEIYEHVHRILEWAKKENSKGAGDC